jgi:hypothetical protein
MIRTLADRLPALLSSIASSTQDEATKALWSDFTTSKLGAYLNRSRGASAARAKRLAAIQNAVAAANAMQPSDRTDRERAGSIRQCIAARPGDFGLKRAPDIETIRRQLSADTDTRDRTSFMPNACAAGPTS